MIAYRSWIILFKVFNLTVVDIYYWDVYVSLNVFLLFSFWNKSFKKLDRKLNHVVLKYSH